MGGASQSNRQLVRALGERFAVIERLETSTRDWASMTFNGVVHHLCFTTCGDTATLSLIETIGEVDWPMAGQFVADILVTDQQVEDGGRLRLSMEVLTIFDA